MTTSEVEKIIIENLADRQFPIYLRNYQNRGFSEADIFGISKYGQMYEYEIKISRADFLADFKHKQHKHQLLKDRNAKHTYAVWKRGKCTNETYDLIVLPNRFYYACTEGLINVSEVPEYAGLIYCDQTNKYNEVKPAILLHHTKANEIIYKNIATLLSERKEWGCAYRVYKYKQVKQ